jgi:hypothetical protein
MLSKKKEAMPPDMQGGGAASYLESDFSERQSLSAHRTAEPLNTGTRQHFFANVDIGSAEQ